ncbi:MAG: preprotein translocase subunit YajC [Ruminococcus sp.]|jgi:preprotein translocase subunit YajC|nr:preprotein translocase subunit YajC [Ruminococcus sp.]
MPLLLSVSSPAAEAGEQAMGSGSIVYTLVMLVLMIVVFYFLLIRPQKKKEKAAKVLRDSMQIGDEVTTIGGITGIVVKITEDAVVVETGGDRSKIRVKKWAISENATVHDDTQETLVK